MKKICPSHCFKVESVKNRDRGGNPVRALKNQNIVKLVAVLFLFQIVPCIAFSQQVEEYLESQTSTVPFQKLYLHTDREFYFENDTIWFCAYHVDGQTHVKEQSFCNLYVDMVNNEGEIVLDELFIIGNGIASGYIPLEKSVVPEGIYLLRAYTEYLKNFGDKAIFTKSIYISSVKNSFELEDEKESRTSSVSVNPNNPTQSNIDIDIIFMPEGGYLLANENNCVAFKAVDSTGKAVEIRGELQDESGMKVLEFETIYQGAGKFYFMPEAEETYNARIVGINQLIPLPEVKESGAKIKFVNQDSHGVRLVIQERNLKEAPFLYLTCIHRGKGLFYYKVEKQHFNTNLEIKVKELGVGINRFVLLDNNLNPVSERMIFIGENAINQLEVGVNKPSFSRRQKVELDVLTTILSEDSLRHVSIAVVDENYVNAKGVMQNIASYLLLDSELNGHIDSPANYLVDSEKMKKNTKLDLLMLTNGWSNYIWNTINADSLDLIYEPKLGLTFKGHVKRAFGKKAIAEGGVSMILKKSDSTSSFLNEPIDSNGNFEFNNVVVFDSVTVIAQARNKKNRNNLRFDIQLPENDPPVIGESVLHTLQNYSEIPYSTYRQRYLEFMKMKAFFPDKDKIQIEEVEIKGWHYDPKIKTGVVRRNDGPYKLTSEETKNDMDIISYLANNVSGIYSSLDSTGKLVVSVRSNLGAAAIVLDGFNMITQDEAREYSIGIFETIEIRTPPMSYIYGTRYNGDAANGAIILTTQTEYQIRDHESIPFLGGIVDRINGFTPLREFYSPKYTTDNIDSEILDYRQTLFWNPLVNLKNGRGKISFFTADNLGRYKIFIEGISENGNIYLGNAEFEVNELEKN